MKRTCKYYGLAAILGLFVVTISAQSPLFDTPNRTLIKSPAVEYLFPEQINVPAGKSTAVTLHFRIGPGLHINSHKPHEESLIPTAFSIPDGSGVRLDSAVYPAGVDMLLPADPKNKLNVYTGEFAVQARITATTAGNHLVQGKLRYQACDQQACMPPRTISVAIDVIAK